MLKLTLIFVIVLSSAQADESIYKIWRQIPFNIQGANLGEFTSAFSKDRFNYLRELKKISYSLSSGRYFQRKSEIERFNELYEKNLTYASKALGAFLESSFKSFLDQYYRSINPRVRKLSFSYGHSILQDLLRQSEIKLDERLDFFFIGNYTLASDCSGHVIASLELIASNGNSRSYQAQGEVSIVMSKIASKVFEDFQRTQFPSQISYRGEKLTLLGGANNNVATSSSLFGLTDICRSKSARLPTLDEYKYLNALGSWSGGLFLKDKAWALDDSNVVIKYNGEHRRRNIAFISERKFHYICVRSKR